MSKKKHMGLVKMASGILAALLAWLGSVCGVQAAIEVDLEGEGYPGVEGRGWSGPWASTDDQVPEILSQAPLEGERPYLHVDFGGEWRNLLRGYESGAGVDSTRTHRIRWAFRLAEEEGAFEENFATFNDRIHFFARNEPRLTGGTDASMSWGIFAVGEAHSSGAGAGGTFWVYDNEPGESGFDPDHAVDTGVALVPGDVYSFEVTVNPAHQLYTVEIRNEESGESFTSSSPHRFRDLSADVTSHNLLHFGVRADEEEPRAFDLSSVVIESAVGAVPVPPRIANIRPFDQGIHQAGDGIRFDVISESPVEDEAIRVRLNGEDVSEELRIEGEGERRHVVFDGLEADQSYTAEIEVTTEGGTATELVEFRTLAAGAESVVVFDSGGFEDDSIYPLGPLENVTHGDATWLPADEPAEVVDSEEPDFGKVLRRLQTGGGNNDFLEFPEKSSGVLTVTFDARVSTTDQRTLDLMLYRNGTTEFLLGWGINPGQVSFFDGDAWVAVADVDDQWHRYEMEAFLSGPLNATFNLKIDGEVVGRGLPSRHKFEEGTPATQLRVGGIRGPAGEYGEIDNLVIEASPEPAPPPEISNVTPEHRSQFHPAAEGFRFEVASDEPIPEDGIRLVLNGSDVSEELGISGEETQRSVVFEGLAANTLYEAEIEVTNELGTSSRVVRFDTIAESTVVFDTEGFEDADLYPVGPLEGVTDGIGRWTPGRTGEPAEIIDSGEAEFGKVLRRSQTGENSVDILDFTPFASGLLTLEFDARVSTADSRTLDMALNRTGQTQRGSFLSWGTHAGQVSYFDGSEWNAFAELDEEWHHYELEHYLSGGEAHTFDVRIDGELVAEGLPWDMSFAAGTPFGRLRVGGVNGAAGDYADLDNLAIRITPPPPGIELVSPSGPATFHSAEAGLQFEVTSPDPVPEDGIEVLVNGQDVTDQLDIGGEPTSRSIAYTQLRSNTFYHVTIRVTNALGTFERELQFDTFNENDAVIIEAEDYNYESGQFQDDPPPSGFAEDGTMVNGGGTGYLDLEGTSGIDFSVTLTQVTDPQASYRFLDPVTTRPAEDFVREKYQEAGVPDFEVWNVVSGDWMNYTRTFPEGEYRVRLRAQSAAEHTLRLEAVTSDRTELEQTTDSLGVFNVADASGDYRYTDLTDPDGNVRTIELDGVETLRLSAEEVDEDLALNFLVLTPALDETGEILIESAAATANGFELSWATEAGVEYAVEYADDLRQGQWTLLETVSGNGEVQAVVDPSLDETQRFYRVRVE